MLLNLRHLFGVCFLTLAQQLFFFFLSTKGWYVELRDRKKEYNLGHVGWIQKSQEIFQNNLEKGLRWKEGEKMDSYKKIWSWNIFISLKIFIPLLWDFWSSLSLTLFFNTFSFLFLSFSAPSLYFGILKIFEEKINFKFLFGWDGSGYTKNMKIGEMQIYWRWTHTP
jgi:hypothetical protein